jgi:signal transduction histidine kinase
MELTPAENLQLEVMNRFGLLPNFFRLTQDPQIMKNLWSFARFAYLDNPLPSLFKERLFVYLSRFCEVRYCIARHVGFLLGLGRPSGDAACAAQSIDDVLALVRRRLPRGEDLQPVLAQCEVRESPLVEMPEPDSPMEQAIFTCATHVFLQSSDSVHCLTALRRSLGEPWLQYLTVLLGFVRTAHYWTKIHDDLQIEDDISQLLKTHESLANCILNDPEATSSLVSAYEVLREADRRKDEFLAMLAHEIRNPLAAIRNAVQFLLQTEGDAGRARSAIEILDRQVAHMERQVEDLLDVSRVSRGKIELRKARIELAPVVNQAVEAIRPLCERLAHELIIVLPSTPLFVHGDQVRLAQIVGNLLNNACKFTDPGGQIRLTLEQEGEQAVLRVRDTGIGLATDELSRIFDIFAQVDRSLERARDGLGLGLALVKNLVKLHGGTVEARSAGPGQGSEFVVRLPLQFGSQPALPRNDPSDLEPVATAACRILVVDDNRDSAKSLTMLLKLMGHEVDTAHDGLEAVGRAAKFQPDVILLDIGMPGLNGYEAARRIREQQPRSGVRLVALTGWSQDEDRRRSEQAGFDAHLVKPVNLSALKKLLAEWGTR